MLFYGRHDGIRPIVEIRPRTEALLGHATRVPSPYGSSPDPRWPICPQITAQATAGIVCMRTSRVIRAVQGTRSDDGRVELAAFVSEHEQGETPDRLMFAEGVGMLIALLDTGALDRRRYTVVNRLRQLQHTDDFASLPEDLRERIREITAEAER
jgi:hypothetical protein